MTLVKANTRQSKQICYIMQPPPISPCRCISVTYIIFVFREVILTPLCEEQKEYSFLSLGHISIQWVLITNQDLFPTLF